LNQYSLENLIYLMERLRDSTDGCPWDLQQDFKTIVASTIEEAYEVADTIEVEDFDHLESELGDLLFQVIFYSQLGKEKDLFNFNSIVSVLVEKLLRRHPHVFPDGTLQSRSTASVEERKRIELQVKKNWEAIKQQERESKGINSLLEDVPVALPALTRAAKLQKRAATVGFDWSDVTPVIAKLKEEIVELEEALAKNDDENVAEELGDLFFAMVNISRHLRQDPETILRAANKKFTRRFQYIEQQLASESKPIADAGLEEMERLWVEAKACERR